MTMAADDTLRDDIRIALRLTIDHLGLVAGVRDARRLLVSSTDHRLRAFVVV